MAFLMALPKIKAVVPAADSKRCAESLIFRAAITQPWPGAYTIRERIGIRGGGISPDIMGL